MKNYKKEKVFQQQAQSIIILIIINNRIFIENSLLTGTVLSMFDLLILITTLQWRY